MANLAYLLQLERHVEDSVERVLKGNGCKVYRTRGVNIETSPRVEIVAEVGAALDQVYTFNDGVRWAYCAWKGTLSVLVVTNRTETETRTQAHQGLLGLVRASLQQHALVGTDGVTDPKWYGEIVLLVDIREAGTTQRFEDEKDLDYSELNFDIRFQVNSQMWEDKDLILTEDGNFIVTESGEPIQLDNT